MQTKNVKQKGISSDANIIEALRTMKGKVASPNMGSATSNRYVAPVAPNPMADETAPADQTPREQNVSGTSEVALPVTQIGGTVQPGDRVSITITRVSGGMAFGRPTVTRSGAPSPGGVQPIGSNLSPKVIGA